MYGTEHIYRYRAKEPNMLKIYNLIPWSPIIYILTDITCQYCINVIHHGTVDSFRYYLYQYNKAALAHGCSVTFLWLLCSPCLSALELTEWLHDWLREILTNWLTPRYGCCSNFRFSYWVESVLYSGFYDIFVGESKVGWMCSVTLMSLGHQFCIHYIVY